MNLLVNDHKYLLDPDDVICENTKLVYVVDVEGNKIVIPPDVINFLKNQKLIWTNESLQTKMSTADGSTNCVYWKFNISDMIHYCVCNQYKAYFTKYYLHIKPSNV